MMVSPPPAGGTIDAQVAIVGAGPAGLALALRLGRAGVDTVVLESGGTGPDAWTTALAEAVSIEPPDHPPLEHATRRQLGGASWTWGGRCVDFEPLDFEPDRHPGVSGWPISYAEAHEAAPAAAEFLGIGGAGFEEDLPWIAPDGGLCARLERWCVQPRLAKAHAHEIRRSGKVRFLTGLTCTNLGLAPSGREVAALTVRDRAGAARRVTAQHYVVAAGGIETARLLLASNDVSAAGVGGGSGWLGRAYMGHLQGVVADLVLTGLREDQIDYRSDGEAFVRPRLMLTAERLKAEGLLNIAFLPDNPVLGDWRHRSGALSASALALSTPVLGPALLGGPIREILLGGRMAGGDVPRHLRNMVLDLPGTASFVATFVAGRLNRRRRPGAFVHNRARRYELKYYAEQSPLFESRVRLCPDQPDALGLPRVAVEKRVAPRDLESVRRCHEILAAELEAAGLARLEWRAQGDALVERINGQTGDGYHQVGLARMSADPADGVVDPHCQVHGVGNLHLAGSAVFPTSGQANPTYLITCLSLRLAERLVGRINGRPATVGGPEHRGQPLQA